MYKSHFSSIDSLRLCIRNAKDIEYILLLLQAELCLLPNQPTFKET